jgi:pyruvate/2-oxoglutarate/acetoin dehydrogenase E1 component
MGGVLSRLELQREAMERLADNKQVIFVGQSVVYDGQEPFRVLERVPMAQRVEFPVAENTQLGFCIGLSLQGYLPVCMFPRMDFLILAMDALVNHLDKINTYSAFQPKVIIRTSVGKKHPVNPGPQHCQDHTLAIKLMLKTVQVIEVNHDEDLLDAYDYAANTERSTLVVENLP